MHIKLNFFEQLTFFYLGDCSVICAHIHSLTHTQFPDQNRKLKLPCHCAVATVTCTSICDICADLKKSKSHCKMLKLSSLLSISSKILIKSSNTEKFYDKFTKKNSFAAKWNDEIKIESTTSRLPSIYLTEIDCNLAVELWTFIFIFCSFSLSLSQSICRWISLHQ